MKPNPTKPDQTRPNPTKPDQNNMSDQNVQTAPTAPTAPTVQLIKRNQSVQYFDAAKLRANLVKVGQNLSVDIDRIVQHAAQGCAAQMTADQLVDHVMHTIAGFATLHPDYDKLATRTWLNELYKKTPETFSQYVDSMLVDTPKGKSHLASQAFIDFVKQHSHKIDQAIDDSRDESLTFFGLTTLVKSYLVRIDDKVIERPQYLWMRTSLAMNVETQDIQAVLETYDLISKQYYTHATPTLFNSGMRRGGQLASCFLLMVKDDSTDGIMDTAKLVANVSKFSGGIGLSVTNLRGKGAYIGGTNGTSNGLVNFLQMYSKVVSSFDQGGGKRKGSATIYLEPWHSDVEAFVELTLNGGSEDQRARDLFTALWVPDLFMRRVQQQGQWSLFCPSEAPGLDDLHGAAFDQLYEQYEKQNKARKTIPAQQLWKKILHSQMTTGRPFMLYKDSCNAKSNQKHLGTIRCSNLCTEIVEFTSPDEVAVCNLASISLPKFVKFSKARRDSPASLGQAVIDYDLLAEIAGKITVNLNKVLDTTMYPIQEAKTSNQRHRPIGIGVQGLADVLAMCKTSFGSQVAMEINTKIFEAIYFGSLTASMNLAKQKGPYSSYAGSPVSQNILQPDMWNVKTSDSFDWPGLREQIRLHGVRNSLLVAPMPTASTSQIMGNTECIEPFTSNVFSRMTMAGNFVVLNRHLVRDLEELGMWSEKMSQQIVKQQGSIQQLVSIPEEIRKRYRTVWEIPGREIIDMAVARAPYICQSQSLNIYFANPQADKMTSMHFYGWKKGLKTGMYYLRSQAATKALSVLDDHLDQPNQPDQPGQPGQPGQPVGSASEECLMCGS